MSQPRSPGETNAVIAGRMIARTSGYPAEAGDTRFRCRVARVGARIVDLVDPDRGVNVTLAEITRDRWTVVSGTSEEELPTTGTSFVDAVDEAYVLYANPPADA